MILENKIKEAKRTEAKRTEAKRTEAKRIQEEDRKNDILKLNPNKISDLIEYTKMILIQKQIEIIYERSGRRVDINVARSMAVEAAELALRKSRMEDTEEAEEEVKEE